MFKLRTCFSESLSCLDAGATAGVSSFRLYSGLFCFRRASGLRLLNLGGVEGLLRPLYLFGGEPDRLFLLFLSLEGDLLLRSLDGDLLLRCGEPELPRPRRGGGDGEPVYKKYYGLAQDFYALKMILTQKSAIWCCGSSLSPLVRSAHWSRVPLFSFRGTALVA